MGVLYQTVISLMYVGPALATVLNDSISRKTSTSGASKNQRSDLPMVRICNPHWEEELAVHEDKDFILKELL